jgi:hypothetical protein
MAVGIAVVVVVAAIAGLVVVLRGRAQAAERDGEGANEILASPPTSFPSDLPRSRDLTRPAPPTSAPPPSGSAPASTPPSAPTAPATSSPPPAPASSTAAASPATPVSTPSPAASPADDAADEQVAARFRAPGARTATPGASAAPAPSRPLYPLEPADLFDAPTAGEPDPEVLDPIPSAEPTEPAVEPTPEPASPPAAVESRSGEPASPPEAAESPAERAPEAPTEPEPAPEAPAESPAEPVVAEVESTRTEPATVDKAEPAVAAPAPTLSLVTPAPVIDLAAPPDDAQSHEEAWRSVRLEPEPDAVDHVLQALINRARFKQVGVEEVATELVERADLRGEEVSDVLAELVGRADDSELDPVRSSELVLFNDEVPSRPGQLTDFAKLRPADKKRIIIRVLCLLVARSEDQQLPPRNSADPAAARSWPLARAVWPTATGDDEPEVALPSLPSRLAKSG